MQSKSEPKIGVRIAVAVLLALCLVLVVTPRFDRPESGMRGKLTGKGDEALEKIGDAKYYIANVEWVRGEGVSENLISPWSCRLLSPAIAAVLPFKPMTALNIVNVAALLVAVWFIYLILAKMKFDYWWRIIGCCMFVFSFPVFFYGAIGYVDPMVLCFLAMGAYFTLTERWELVLLTIIIGVLAKEAIVVLLPFVAVYVMVNKFERPKQIQLIVASFLFFVITYFLVKLLNPGIADYTRLPNMENTMLNLTRPRAYQAFVLAFGIPGFLSLFALRHVRKNSSREYINLLGPFVAGMITAFLLYIYSFISAYADGRIIWTSYPFTIPLAVFVLNLFVRTRAGRTQGAGETID